MLYSRILYFFPVHALPTTCYDQCISVPDASDNRFALLKCWKTSILSSCDITHFCDTKAVTTVWAISYIRDTALTLEFRDTMILKICLLT